MSDPALMVQVVRLSHEARLPERMSAGSAGWDIRAALQEPLVLGPGERVLVPTGLSFVLPGGTEAQIRPRSGLALKHGVTVLNSPGTVDSDYRGEIKVILVNLGDSSFEVKPGMRIAQVVFSRVAEVKMVEGDTLPETRRGSGGFGHTGA